MQLALAPLMAKRVMAKPTRAKLVTAKRDTGVNNQQRQKIGWLTGKQVTDFLFPYALFVACSLSRC